MFLGSSGKINHSYIIVLDNVILNNPTVILGNPTVILGNLTVMPGNLIQNQNTLQERFLGFVQSVIVSMTLKTAGPKDPNYGQI